MEADVQMLARAIGSALRIEPHRFWGPVLFGLCAASWMSVFAAANAIVGLF